MLLQSLVGDKQPAETFCLANDMKINIPCQTVRYSSDKTAVQATMELPEGEPHEYRADDHDDMQAPRSTKAVPSLIQGEAVEEKLQR